MKKLKEQRSEVDGLWRVAEDLRYRPTTSELVLRIHRQASGLLKAIAITKVSAVINKALKVCLKHGIYSEIRRAVSFYIEKWLVGRISTEEFLESILRELSIRASSIDKLYESGCHSNALEAG